jgi:hypothetical protein
MRSHLLNDATTEHYRRSLAHGVERVAATLATTDRPFTGITPTPSHPGSTRSISTSRSATPPPPWTNSIPSTSGTPSTSTIPVISPTSTALSPRPR